MDLWAVEMCLLLLLVLPAKGTFQAWSFTFVFGLRHLWTRASLQRHQASLLFFNKLSNCCFHGLFPVDLLAVLSPICGLLWGCSDCWLFHCSSHFCQYIGVCWMLITVWMLPLFWYLCVFALALRLHEPNLVWLSSFVAVWQVHRDAFMLFCVHSGHMNVNFWLLWASIACIFLHQGLVLHCEANIVLWIRMKMGLLYCVLHTTHTYSYKDLIHHMI